MAEDHELPVWGVRPNWSEPIIETLTWQTDVLQSLSGAEQRISQRLAPRRMIEARYNPHEHERTFVDLVMHRLSRIEWMMPLWFDGANLNAPAVVGSTRLNFDTAYHEFMAGGMAYLVGQDTFSGEAVRIASIDADGIDLVNPLGKAWPSGARIHPMRRGWFEESDHSLLTGRLGESNIRFHVIEGNDLTDEGEWSIFYDSLPVLSQQPNWSGGIDLDLSFLGDEFDALTGKKRVTDTAGRTFRQQQHEFYMSGAAEQYAFRQMLYRLRGQQKHLWLPTFADDIEVAAPAAVGASSIDVRQMGLTYVGGPSDGREHLIFSDGQVVRITSSSPISGQPRERLTLSSGLAAPKRVGDRASFIEKARLASDSIEIEHIGDTDGFSRATLSFKAVTDSRSATTAQQPIPEAEMSNTGCGVPAIANGCVFSPVFEGWYARARVSLINPTTTIPQIFVHPNNSIRIFGNSFGTLYPDTNVVMAILSPDGYSADFYWIDPAVMDAVEVQLRLQFPAGSVGSQMRATFAFQKWNQNPQDTWFGSIAPKVESTVMFPGLNSWSLGTPFDVRGLWPDDWFFDVTGLGPGEWFPAI